MHTNRNGLANVLVVAAFFFAVAPRVMATGPCDESNTCSDAPGTDPITVTNITETCHAQLCDGQHHCNLNNPCVATDVMTATATINLTNPSGLCTTARVLAVCQSWISCTNGSTVTGCNRCDFVSTTIGSSIVLGSVGAPPLQNCTRGNDCLFYQVTVNDVTTSYGSGGCTSSDCNATTPNVSACSAVGSCGTNCTFGSTETVTGTGCCM